MQRCGGTQAPSWLCLCVWGGVAEDWQATGILPGLMYANTPTSGGHRGLNGRSGVEQAVGERKAVGGYSPLPATSTSWLGRDAAAATDTSLAQQVGEEGAEGGGIIASHPVPILGGGGRRSLAQLQVPVLEL